MTRLRCLLLLVLLAARLPAADETTVLAVDAAGLTRGTEPRPAAVFTGASSLLLPISGLQPTAGTLELYLQPAADTGDAVLPLFSLGTNAPLWWLLTLQGRELSLLCENQGAIKLPGSYYVRLTAKLPAAPADAPLHLAIVWAALGEGQSLVQLYVNGRLRDARDNATLAPSFGTVTRFGLGCNTANARQPGFVGRLYYAATANRPLAPATLAAHYAELQQGRPPAFAAENLLQLDFQTDLNARAATRAPLTAPELDAAVRAIRESLAAAP